MTIFVHAGGDTDDNRVVMYHTTFPEQVPVSMATETESTVFKQLEVSQQTPIFSVNSSYGLNILRNVTDTDGVTGTVTFNEGEFALATGTDAGGSAVLDTRERGRYQSGFPARVGIGVRVPSLPTGDQDAKWGYFDDNNGFGWGVDANGFYIFVLRDGTETKTHRNDWLDPLDGTGASGLTIDLTAGLIFQATFTWYGYGSIQYSFLPISASGKNYMTEMHRIERLSGTGVSILNPNLPIRARVDNNGETSTFGIRVGGRQFSVIGPFAPRQHVTTAVTSFSGPTVTTTPYPVVSVRRRAGNLYDGLAITLGGVDILSDTTLVLRVIAGGTLGGSPSWAIAPLHDTSTTGVEFDTSATSVTGGTCVFGQLIVVNQRERLGFNNDAPLDVILGASGSDVLTVTVEQLSGSSTPAITALWRINEEA